MKLVLPHWLKVLLKSKREPRPRSPPPRQTSRGCRLERGGGSRGDIDTDSGKNVQQSITAYLQNRPDAEDIQYQSDHQHPCLNTE